jgi:hypothetical protein
MGNWGSDTCTQSNVILPSDAEYKPQAQSCLL